MAVPRLLNTLAMLLPPRQIPRLLVLLGVFAFFLVTTGVFRYQRVVPQVVKAGEAVHSVAAVTTTTPTKSPEPLLIRKPEPTGYVPPPIVDPFPTLERDGPPPLPKWNKVPVDLYKQYNLTVAPPLLIGFTRNYPMLLQAVVSYITAGWPPSHIYVIENTGVQRSNQRGLLTLQNPFYLNHKALKRLGVNIVMTPTLLSFAQLQNFYHAMSYDHEWPYYFWSHMDVVAFSYENGHENLTSSITEPGFKNLYELSLRAVQKTLDEPRWGLKLFAYDHYSLVNAKMVEDIGGWDTFIPYYTTDCDYHGRVEIAGWTLEDALVGIINDVGSYFADLRALYRVPGVSTDLHDPHPPPPESVTATPTPAKSTPAKPTSAKPTHTPVKSMTHVHNGTAPGTAADLAYWKAITETGDRMLVMKTDAQHDRLGWQQSQRGGFGEPFYYPPEGMAEALTAMIYIGKNVFGAKWGDGDCGVIGQNNLTTWDQWKMMKNPAHG